MDKKLRLADLPFQMMVSAYGVTLGLRAERQSLLRRFARAWPYGCEATESSLCDRMYSIIETEKDGWKLYADARKIAEVRDAEDLRRRLRSNAQLFIAANTNQYVFIHAGVVAFADEAILIPGRSYSGKTTLVAAFVKAGATYYSDEYAVLDEHGRVHPYPRPLSVRSRRTGKQREVAAEHFGTTIGVKPIGVRLILLTKYQAGARWEPQQVGARDASKGLALNAVAIRRSPAATLKAIARVAANAAVLQGVRGEAQALIKTTRQYLR